MNSLITRLFFLALLALFVAAPFAGLAPLLLVVLFAATASAIWSLVRTLVVGENPQEKNEIDV